MRWRLIMHVVGWLTLFFGLTMIIALMTSLLVQDGSGIPMLIALVITTVCGSALILGFRGIPQALPAGKPFGGHSHSK